MRLSSTIMNFLGMSEGKKTPRGDVSPSSGVSGGNSSNSLGESPGKSRPSSKGLPRVVQPITLDTKNPKRVTPAVLEETMNEIAQCVKSWDEGGYTMVGNLQDAIRNHGSVDLMRTPENTKVAVKRMPTRWVMRSAKEFRENYPTASEKPWNDLGVVRQLNKLGFPYVCELLEVFRDHENTYVATTLASKGDLFSWCDLDPKPGPAREAVMKPIVTQVGVAIKWLHELGIAHRDISLENILLTEVGGKMQVKVIDFGMVTLNRICNREVRGKQSYSAPEMHLEGDYDAFLSDAFAVGVVIFAMAAQDYPWTATKRNACQLFEYVSLFGFRKFLGKRRLRKGNGEHLSDVFSPELVDVLDSFLEIEVAERLTLGEGCFAAAGPGGKPRASFWDQKWLQGVDVSGSTDLYDRLAGA